MSENNKQEILLTDLEVNGFVMTGRASKGESYSVFEVDLANAYINDIDDSVEITEAVNPYWDKGPGFVTPEEIWDEIDDRYGNLIESQLKKTSKTFEEAISSSLESCQEGFIPYDALNPAQIVKASSIDKMNRIFAAKKGWGLDVLVEDPHADVRVAVANQGYGLEELVQDTYWKVREAVAEQGYGIDRLLDDKDEWVNRAAYKYLEDNEIHIDDWIKQNPDKCALPENQQRYQSVDGLRKPYQDVTIGGVFQSFFGNGQLVGERVEEKQSLRDSGRDAQAASEALNKQASVNTKMPTQER